MTADPLELADARLASIDLTIRRHDLVAGRGSAAPAAGRLGRPVTAGPFPPRVPETLPGSADASARAALSAPAADCPPRVLTETWRPLVFRADGSVELGAPRTGPARSDQLRPPVEVRLTDGQLDALLNLLWPA